MSDWRDIANMVYGSVRANGDLLAKDLGEPYLIQPLLGTAMFGGPIMNDVSKYISPRRHSFFEELRKANPAGARLLDENRTKADLATALRGLRMSRRLTQVQVAEASGLTQAAVSRMEAPTGPVPSFETVLRYAEACGAEMSVRFRIVGHQTADSDNLDFDVRRSL